MNTFTIFITVFLMLLLFVVGFFCYIKAMEEWVNNQFTCMAILYGFFGILSWSGLITLFAVIIK